MKWTFCTGEWEGKREKRGEGERKRGKRVKQ